jgi:hypothetical protein
MKLMRIMAICLLSSFLTVASAQQVIPFDDPRWTIQAQAFLKEPYKGFNSLYLTNGLAYLKGVDFSDGIIEFDMYQTLRPSFSGMIFRLKDVNNYEELYLRAHQSGFPDAYQYTPVFNNDPAWQLYHDAHDAVQDGFIHWKPRNKLRGYNTMIEYGFDRWTHVKLVLKNQQAELFIDHQPKPAAFIPELIMQNGSGSLGLKSGAGGTWFSNFSFIPGKNVSFITSPDNYEVVTPPGTIKAWQVSTPFAEKLVSNTSQLHNNILASLTWKPITVEKTGLVNISRLYQVTESNTVIAKISVESTIDQVKKLDFGYSDRIKVFFNGNAIYSGQGNFRSRDYRYLGTIGYFDAVYLPLKKGSNVIMIAVSETFGGWGIMAKWENEDGLIK